MRPVKRWAIGAALLSAACSPVAAPPPPAEAVRATQALCRPQFVLDGKRLEAGTGFLLTLDGRTVLATAHQLFGPTGGAPQQVSAPDLPQRVSGMTCAPFDGRGAWSAGAAIPVPDAHPSGMPVRYRDVAVFPVAPTGGALDGTKPLRLAARSPRKGDTVWLVAPHVRGAPAGRRLHAARIDTITPRVLAVVFEDEGLDLLDVGGAPFVDAAGDVVGTMVATGKLRLTGQVTGYANSLGALRQAFADAGLVGEGAGPAGG